MPQNTASCCSQLKRSGKLDLLLNENDRLVAKRAEAERIKKAIQQARDQEASWLAELRQQEVTEGLTTECAVETTRLDRGRTNKGTRGAGGFQAIANGTPFAVSRTTLVELIAVEKRPHPCVRDEFTVCSALSSHYWYQMRRKSETVRTVLRRILEQQISKAWDLYRCSIRRRKSCSPTQRLVHVH